MLLPVLQTECMDEICTSRPTMTKCIHSVLLMDDGLEKYNYTVLLTSIHADINSLTNLNILGCCE